MIQKFRPELVGRFKDISFLDKFNAKQVKALINKKIKEDEINIYCEKAISNLFIDIKKSDKFYDDELKLKIYAIKNDGSGKVFRTKIY